ncbi:MAG: hypothetical protein ACOYOK_09185 [Pseudobdellovibrionaceae bacterium]
MNQKHYNKLSIHILVLAFLFCMQLSRELHADDDSFYLFSKNRACDQIPESAGLVNILLNSPLLKDKNFKLKDFTEFQVKLTLELNKLAQNIYQAYRLSRWSNKKSQALDQCLSTWVDRNKLDYAMQAVFKEQTLLEFKNTRSPLLQKFAEQIQTQGTELTRIFGHFHDPSPTGDKGGFHRGERSLFLDFSKIPPNEWLLIFAHEYFHATDQTLMKAIAVYSDEGTVKKIIGLTKKYQKYSDLTEDDKKILRPWIKAGFDRGLFAEIRAWVGTVLVYQELLNENKIQPIAWMERFYNQASTATNHHHWDEIQIRTEVIRFLSPRFTDPRDGIFSLPLIQDAMIAIRKEVLTQALQ